MPDQTQIVHSALVAAPNTYPLADNVELLLYAVAANFTDDGAGTDWLPAVVLLSDSDHVIARALLQGETVTAGDDAEVSWFPGVKPGGAAGAAGLPSCVCNLDIGTGTFGAGAHDLPILTLATTAPSIFSTPGGGSALVNIAEDGFYLVSARVGISPAALVNTFLSLYVAQDDALGWSHDIDVYPNDARASALVSDMRGVTFASMAATDFIAAVLQADGGITNVVSAGLAIVQLNPMRLV